MDTAASTPEDQSIANEETTPVAQSYQRSSSPSYIGLANHFVSGPFAGQTIRAELAEVQSAEVGRKYGKVDRRPLSPPPVVLLRLFNVYNAGSPDEVEREITDYSAVDGMGLICYVDLFPAPPWAWDDPSLSANAMLDSAPQNVASSLSHVENAMQEASEDSEGIAPETVDGVVEDDPDPEDSDVAARLGRYIIRESTRATDGLVGETLAEPVHIPWQGRQSLLFVFSDLAVKLEGTFILRFRLFDIHSRVPNEPDAVVLAECYGKVFKVFSNREFPGLRPSTELNKLLERYKVRLHIREPGRKRMEG